LVQTVLSLETELWAFYAGILFVATVMYFPGGLAGLIMMHVPAIRLGKARLLVEPYVKTLLPGGLAILAGAALVEMIFHLRHASAGDHEMTLFWITFDSHAIGPWVIAIGVFVAGIWVCKRGVPDLQTAWAQANSVTEPNT
jgi:branched-chain amino acid transport system permease protein